MTEIVKPSEVFDSPDVLPPSVIETWNELIKKNRKASRHSIVRQDEAVKALMVAMGVERQKVFDNGWLEIEGAYKSAGWNVYYDKPGYNEDYEAYFKFTESDPQ